MIESVSEDSAVPDSTPPADADSAGASDTPSDIEDAPADSAEPVDGVAETEPAPASVEELLDRALERIDALERDLKARDLREKAKVG